MVLLRNCLVASVVSFVLSVSAFGFNSHYLPQAAVGVLGDLRFMTQISITNPGHVPSSAVIHFLTNEGDAWTVTTSCLENDAYNGAHSTLTITVPAESKYAISMSSSGDIAVGWVEIVSPDHLGIAATYGFYQRLPGTVGKIPSDPLWEAAVLPAPSAMELSFAAHRRQGDLIFGVDVNTGYAVANPNTVAAEVIARIYDSAGAQLDDLTFTLAPRGHAAQFIDELFKGIDLSDFRGVVRLSSNVPIAGLAMREGKRLEKAVYSTIPVQPDSDDAIGVDYEREPNNSVDTAITIQPDSQIYGTVSSAAVAGGGPDYYKIQVTAGQRIAVVLLAGSLGSPLYPSLSIRDQGNLVLSGGLTLYDDARDLKAEYTSTTGGAYFICVQTTGISDSRRAFYRLFVRVF